MSRNNGFAIEVIDRPASGDAAGGFPEAVGRIRVGDFVESFPMNLSYWGTEDYVRSWRRALRILEESDTAVSCLVSSITEPETSNFVFCWPLYRQGDDVFVQNAVIFLEGAGVDADVEMPFRADAPWLSVRPRTVVDEDGNRVSEWRTEMAVIREFSD